MPKRLNKNYILHTEKWINFNTKNNKHNYLGFHDFKAFLTFFLKIITRVNENLSDVSVISLFLLLQFLFQYHLNTHIN